MRTGLVVAVLLLVVGSVGCQKYIPVPNSAADRIWIVTADGTEVFRCWDLKNQLSKPFALCRRAEMVGKTEQTGLTDAAERTSLPPHRDSTELGGGEK